MPVDPDKAAAKDSVLNELFPWASTVVKLPLKGSVSWLSDEMKVFPGEFLLFSDKIGSLDFEDRVEGTSTTWAAHRTENKVSLTDGSTNSEWMIFRHQHDVSAEASLLENTLMSLGQCR
jgi:hypothetical protein